MSEPCAIPGTIPTVGTGTTGLIGRCWSRLKAYLPVPLRYLASLGNPSDRTTEVRLLAFGLFVVVGLALTVIEFCYTRRINNMALGTMGATCGLGALSMRGDG